MMKLPAHKTKVVATIGPASNSPAVLEQMIRAGMNVARLNFSHGDFETHRVVIERVRAASQAVGLPVAILADLPGPKMRLGKFGGERIELEAGDEFTLTTDEVLGDQERVSVSFLRLPQVVKAGDRLSLNDGYVQLEVREVVGAEVRNVVKVGGELRSRKGLNLPGIDLGISAFTEHDRACLEYALEHGADAVSLSFVDRAEDLHAVREAAKRLGKAPFIIAKIERAGALERLEEILEAADGLMIARGDLGVEVPIERIAVVQKQIMRRALQMAKPVITATQMLESMISYRLPTRAEATDVSNAILDGTDCVMLSAESAVGAFPVEAVAMLARIAGEVEPTRRSLDVKEVFEGVDLRGKMLPMHLISVSVEASLDFLKPAAVFALTETGDTARRLATFRLPVWTIAPTQSRKAAQDLLFSAGVMPLLQEQEPESWCGFLKEWVKAKELVGDFAILTRRTEHARGIRTHSMEILDL